MNYQETIKQPILEDLSVLREQFIDCLSHSDGLLDSALSHVRSRSGKMMRPILVLLIAKAFGEINESTIKGALGLELLHTASLIHDDVVDESNQRRGQKSVNNAYGNKVAVLVGDYVLSTALQVVAQTSNPLITEALAILGKTLANGEILQLSTVDSDEISEERYYRIIEQKTSVLFETCCRVGGLSVGLSEKKLARLQRLGTVIGNIFQIKDDIFDYFPSETLGKPTGNDMAEGKLTLPVIYALNAKKDANMDFLARKVKSLEANQAEIDALVAFTKASGGIEYAENAMLGLQKEALRIMDTEIENAEVKESLSAYIAYIIDRKI